MVPSRPEPGVRPAAAFRGRTWCWVGPQPLSVHKHTHTVTHMHPCAYVCLYFSIFSRYQKSQVYTDTSNTNSPTGYILGFCLSWCVPSSPNSEKPGFHHPLNIFLFNHPPIPASPTLHGTAPHSIQARPSRGGLLLLLGI